MSSRYEQMLNAIANGEKITVEPMSRLEKYLKAYANGEDVTKLPAPQCREEQCWLSIINGETITAEPQSKREKFLKAIANDEPIPENSGFGKEEQLFIKIAEGSSGPGTPDIPDIPDDPEIINLNFILDGILHIRESYSAAQTAESLTLR